MIPHAFLAFSAGWRFPNREACAYHAEATMHTQTIHVWHMLPKHWWQSQTETLWTSSETNVAGQQWTSCTSDPLVSAMGQQLKFEVKREKNPSCKV